MNRTKILLFAIGIGGAVEAIFCAVGVVSLFTGGIGPCGPSGDFPAWLTFVHQPGVWLAEVLQPDAGLSRLPVIILTTGSLLSAAAYGAIVLARKLRKREDKLPA